MITVLLFFLTSCGTSKQVQADKERLDEIAIEVGSLFNADQDDLAEGINEKSLQSVKKVLDEEKLLDSELSPENRTLLNEIMQLYEEAIAMFDFARFVTSLLENDGMINETDLEVVEEQLLLFADKQTFFERMTKSISAVIERLDEQLAFAEQVLEIENLLTVLIKNDIVVDIVTQKDYEKVAKLLAELEDSEEKEQFEQDLQRIDKKLTELARTEREEKARIVKEKSTEVNAIAKKPAEKTDTEKLAKVNKQTKQTNTTESNNNAKREDTPSVTKPTYVNGVIIASKNYPLPANYAPGESSEARSAFNKMAEAAKRDGLSLTAFSTYRSYDYQVNLYNNYVARDGQAAADRYSARPGYSEHQTGLAFDIGDLRMPDKYFTETEATKWLAKEAYKYGFILRYPQGKEHITGYKYEPWHYRYVGESLAKQIYEQQTTLEEFLGL